MEKVLKKGANGKPLENLDASACDDVENRDHSIDVNSYVATAMTRDERGLKMEMA